MLHLLKLCVGVDSADDLENRIALRLARGGDWLLDGRPYHTTRMQPKRAKELLAGGSLYWVIKGGVQARQRIADIVPFIDGQGIPRCNLVLEPDLVRTAWMPKRPFQGWRYLTSDDAPRDVVSGAGDELPDDMRRQLGELGLL